MDEPPGAPPEESVTIAKNNAAVGPDRCSRDRQAVASVAGGPRRHRPVVVRNGAVTHNPPRPRCHPAATPQPPAHFGRILAAYGGVFVAGSPAWR
ncbi:hypothetical protein [Arthrobacter sp. UYEF3]|uniref:hypothetical protein n=1 Tax=Arthrobacter sp. UYEF3 TaxID=1756365 RepID=UPI00339A3770